MHKGLSSPRSPRTGSVLLLSLLVTGMIATIALSFATSMGTQIQLTRDQAATLHADFASQSGLEYAQRRLLIDPMWQGTADGPLLYTDDTTFTIVRLTKEGSMVLPTEVSVLIEGRQPFAASRLEALLHVNPGDPLLDKAVTVLGDASGSNIKIEGDYMLLDEPGWLWNFRIDLIPDVQADDRLDDTEVKEEQVEIDARTQASKDADEAAGYDKDGVLARKLAASQSADEEKARGLEKASSKASSASPVSISSSIEDLLVHIRKKNYAVEGVWARSKSGEETYIGLDRIDAPGALHNFSEKIYAWAENQIQEKQPIHAPGWDLDQYLNPSPRIRIFDHITEVSDLDIQETAVFLLDEGQTLTLTDINFRGGMIIWTPDDYDYTGDPRNPITLQGTTSFGGGTGGLENVGIIGPGSSLTMVGSQRHSVTGYTLLHSLTQVRRLQHRGVLIVPNSATEVYDSSFEHDPTIAEKPPEGLVFFGDLPGVRVLSLIESYEAPLVP